jgi:hypothetical protein
MGMGGTTDEFRVHIPESFDICTANTSCLTFESGPLAASTEFEIDGIEVSVAYSEICAYSAQVWGCGGPRIVERALVAQEKDRAQRATNIRKARTVCVQNVCCVLSRVHDTNHGVKYLRLVLRWTKRSS